MHVNHQLRKELAEEIEGHKQAIEILSERLMQLHYFDQQEEAASFFDKKQSFESIAGSWKYLFEHSDLCWSEKLYHLFEFDPNLSDLALYEKYLSTFNESDKALLFKKIEEVLAGAKSMEIRHFIHLENGKTKMVDCLAFPVFDAANAIIGLEGYVTEVQDEDLDKTRLSDFFEASVDLQCIANEKGYFVKLSPSWEKLLGYSSQELCAKPFISFVHPDDYEHTLFETKRMLGGALSLSFENRYLTKSGDLVVLNWNAKMDEVTKLIYCTARNVTQERAEQEKLRVILSEKEILLREIHHRVKNNLQIISSLLSIQANIEGDKFPGLRKLYQDSQSRINAMAAIHELFYRSDGLKEINFRNYLEKLVVDVLHSFQGDKSTISVEFLGGDMAISLDTAVPLGLISNELITNAIKHGFKGRENGEIIISLIPLTANWAALTISDNGNGADKSIFNQDDETLGVTIIKSLAEQLDGFVNQLPVVAGTAIEVKFKL